MFRKKWILKELLYFELRWSSSEGINLWRMPQILTYCRCRQKSFKKKFLPHLLRFCGDSQITGNGHLLKRTSADWDESGCCRITGSENLKKLQDFFWKKLKKNWKKLKKIQSNKGLSSFFLSSFFFRNFFLLIFSEFWKKIVLITWVNAGERL